MKLQGIAGKGTGKLGAYVWVVRKGEQIVREYTDKMSNPKSEAQTSQRAKFKLMSQLTAIVADALSFIPSNPAESQRNAFARNNFSLISVSGGAAQINMSAVRLASGRLVAPIFQVIAGNNGMTITMANPEGWEGFGWAFVMSKSDGTVTGKSGITARGTSDITIEGIDPLAQRSDVRAYAWRFKDENALARFQNITAGTTASQVKLQFTSMVNSGEIIT